MDTDTTKVRSAMSLLLLLSSLLAAAPTWAGILLSTRIPEVIRAGHSYKMSIKTSPNVNCRVMVKDASFTRRFNLAEQSSNRFGKAKWRLVVPEDCPVGKMPITITVEKDGQLGKSTKYIDVMK